MIKNINIKIEDDLLDAFEAKIKENNEAILANSLNKSNVIRDLINKYIKK